jgi:hypothetical protein
MRLSILSWPNKLIQYLLARDLTLINENIHLLKKKKKKQNLNGLKSNHPTRDLVWPLDLVL